MNQLIEQFLPRIKQQAEKEYPSECCGLILENRNGVLRLKPMANIQDRLHRENPEEFPRTSRQAYFIDSQELLRVQKEIRNTGETIRIIYHSHIDAEAVFSEEDKRIALQKGEPVYPEAEYLILSVRSAKAVDCKQFRWDAKQKEFKVVGL